MRAIDLTEQRFGRLVAIQCAGSGSHGRLWLVECDCGNQTIVRAGDLRSGNTTSCGCGQREAAARSCVERSTHGLSGHRIMTIHRGMIARCNDPKATSYPYYGARGIKVCEEWHDLCAFAEWAFSNGYSDNLTIDRVGNNRGYEPDNCRWATYKDQANNRNGNLLVTWRGVTKTVAEWSDETGIGVTTLLYRLHAGWDVETAVTRERDHGMRYLG